MLRAKPPEKVTKRLKMFIFGPAGSGKTTACLQFPKCYVIDGERGTENYDKIIKGAGGVVFQTTDVHEAIAEVKSLLTEKHDYRTLVIDPVTPLYNDLLEKCELQVGDSHGRHYGAANKHMKRLANLLMSLDMNVIVTAHAKTEYGANLSKLGYTFDGWRQLDYFFDLVCELGIRGKKRFAKVVKSRLELFPTEDTFEWSYRTICERYSAEIIEKPSQAIALAAPEQIQEMKDLLSVVRLPDGTTERWFAKAGVEAWEDMSADVMAKCLDYVKNRLPTIAAA